MNNWLARSPPRNRTSRERICASGARQSSQSRQRHRAGPNVAIEYAGPVGVGWWEVWKLVLLGLLHREIGTLRQFCLGIHLESGRVSANCPLLQVQLAFWQTFESIRLLLKLGEKPELGHTRVKCATGPMKSLGCPKISLVSDQSRTHQKRSLPFSSGPGSKLTFSWSEVVKMGERLKKQSVLIATGMAWATLTLSVYSGRRFVRDRPSHTDTPS